MKHSVILWRTDTVTFQSSKTFTYKYQKDIIILIVIFGLYKYKGSFIHVCVAV